MTQVILTDSFGAPSTSNDAVPAKLIRSGLTCAALVSVKQTARELHFGRPLKYAATPSRPRYSAGFEPKKKACFEYSDACASGSNLLNVSAHLAMMSDTISSAEPGI